MSHRPARIHSQIAFAIISTIQWAIRFNITNNICKWMHHIVGNVLQTLFYSNLPQNLMKAWDIVNHQALASANHAIQVSVAATSSSMPGALAFNQDMFLNVPWIVNWKTIAKCCERQFNDNLCFANLKWCQYNYALGQQVLKKVHNPTKFGVRATGSYPLEQLSMQMAWSPLSWIQVSPTHQHT